MKALINTFNAIGSSIGTIESLHRTEEAARKADSAIQRAVKKHNGQSSYLPTEVMELAKGRYKVGQHIHQDDLA